MFKFITDIKKKAKNLLGMNHDKSTAKPNVPTATTTTATSKPVITPLPSHLKNKGIMQVAEWAGEQAHKHQRNKAKLVQVADDLIAWIHSKDVKINTKRSYITRINNMIKRKDIKHHDFYSNLSMLINQYPQHKKLLSTLRNVSASKIGGTMADVLKTLKDDSDTSGLYDDLSKLSLYCVITLRLNNRALTRQAKDTAKSEALSRADTRHSQQELIRYADIEAIIKEGLNSESYGRLAFALSLATGRRAIEILYTGSFKALKGSTKSLEFAGQAKKRKGTATPPYPIYVIGCSAEDVVQGVKRLRNIPALKKHLIEAKQLHRDGRNEYIRQRTQNVRAESANRAMGYGHSRKYSKVLYKDSRAIYTRICLDKYLQDGQDSFYKNVSEVQFLQDLLGHSSKKDQQNYLQFIIDYDAPRTPSSERKPNPKIKANNAPVAHENKDSELFEALYDAIKGMDELHPRTRNALLDLNENVIAYANAYPSSHINKTNIRKKIGCSANVANLYAGNTNKKGEVIKGLAEPVLTKYNSKSNCK